MEQFFGYARELLEQGRAVEVEPYGEDSLYDLLNQFQDDVPFYLELACKASGPVLEVGCGSGRVLQHLAKAGIHVVGLDASPYMLQEAAKRVRGLTNVQLVEGDMRTFSLPQKFDLIIMPYCTLIYTKNDEERRAVFERCFSHLKPGGVLAFDFVAGEVELGEGLPYLVLQGTHPFTGEILIHTVQEKGLAPDLRLLNQVSFRIPEDAPAIITVHASLEAVCRSDLIVELLQEIGFSVRGIYSDHTLTPYDGGDSCLVVAER